MACLIQFHGVTGLVLLPLASFFFHQPGLFWNSHRFLLFIQCGTLEMTSRLGIGRALFNDDVGCTLAPETLFGFYSQYFTWDWIYLSIYRSTGQKKSTYAMFWDKVEHIMITWCNVWVSELLLIILMIYLPCNRSFCWEVLGCMIRDRIYWVNKSFGDLLSTGGLFATSILKFIKGFSNALGCKSH